MIHIRYCKRCGDAFDYGTNYDWCSKCRIKKEEETKEEVRGYGKETSGTG